MHAEPNKPNLFLNVLIICALHATFTTILKNMSKAIAIFTGGYFCCFLQIYI